jgi:O-antigen ligase
LFGLFAAAVGASYVVACTRPINAAELNLATLALIGVCGWLGVALLAHDEVNDLGRLRQFLDRVCLAGALFACLGLFQFLTHEVWIDRISIPGLTVNNGAYGLQSREGFTRPTGTAIHAIEFGVVLTMLLPVTLARAATSRHSTTGSSWLGRWLPPIAVIAAIALSSSRSAMVGAAVGSLIVLVRLPKRLRALALPAAGVLGVAMFLAVPGMLGSMLGLFTGIGDDTSALSRLDSYSIALAYVVHAPLFGRGMSTFVPGYRIFDNQYLLSTVEIGLLGVALMMTLFVWSALTGHQVGRTAEDPDVGLMAQGLTGGVAAGATSLALFDAFSFPMVPGLLFLFIGLIGALRRLTDRHALLQVPTRTRGSNLKGSSRQPTALVAQPSVKVARSDAPPSLRPSNDRYSNEHHNLRQ